ncbi:hypothetical protein HUZ36_19370 [Pseudoalteromonas sp. McH1-7]|uniref:Uncharacterized protein n=1 Tax=Pseudoalteromonas peptidolytica F12-50-A1 TaxID=1315280 RepID=A0A8I0MZ20_9GAMM|nr:MULTISPECIES: hypothetical protein [Pseudoalteromonas]MBE0347938.1 hypothetical protein [Pseudoalteromonas peptidolytica F12-50-A1]MDW7551055.1 hypothetical protein [Pseudoalteromonas peptidolytica]NLR16363.1 hypothetical protein [Pseudoalteromonas peptidolytica]NUZ12943.1 hypothetical protein [Pseudoalteromonas sp. McH1-7]RRS07352.1 hypothetical protein EAG18_17205 [Pseudoalteromonas sp. J010]
MSFHLIALLVIFALFGTSATYLIRFMYSYWVKKRLEVKYIINASICGLLVMLVSVISELAR